MTGQIGQVMQESMQAALSWVRSNYARLGLPEDFNKELDLHIHVPGGRHSQGWTLGWRDHGHRGWPRC